jgi:hypothetical protein
MARTQAIALLEVMRFRTCATSKLVETTSLCAACSDAVSISTACTIYGFKLALQACRAKKPRQTIYYNATNNIFPSPRVIPSELFFEALSHNNPVFNSLASSVVEFER